MRAMILLSMLVACHDKAADVGTAPDTAPDPETGEPGAGALQGRVLALDGSPVVGAEVEVEASTTSTDQTGWFYLETVPAGEAVVVRAWAEGFSSGSRRVPISADALSHLSLTLLPAEVLSWDPAEGAELSTEDGVSITFPDAGLIDAEGAPATGPFTVTVAYLDQVDELEAAPGALRASSDAGEVSLRTGGMVEVRLQDALGAPAQIAAPAQLSFPLAEGARAEGLSLWGFDEGAGLWSAADGGGVEGGRFVATVEHFSWWNADEPVDQQQCVHGRLTWPDGRPLDGVTVRGVTPEDWMVAEVSTDDDGGFLIYTGLGWEVSVSLAWGPWSWEGASGTTPSTPVSAVPEDCLQLGTFAVVDEDVDADGYIDLDAGGNDCDDTREGVHPRAREVWYDGLDQDCDGNDGDQDGDGALTDGYDGPYVEGYTSGDCDDTDAEIHPEAIETCDGVDDNCSGDESDAPDAVTYYLDEDGDGYGLDDTATRSCEPLDGYATEDGDCLDSGEGAAEVHPNAEAACTGGDQNCDGVADQEDLDGDGVFGCQGDCDDNNASVHPSAADVCNDLDDDCDGLTDGDPSWYTTVYPDLDGDGYGDDSAAYVGCDPPEADIGVGGDCDDGDAARWAGATEVCDDGVVNDCEGGDAATATELCDWDSTMELEAVGTAMSGEAAYDSAASAVAPAGDVDGDGLMDMLMGATGYGSSSQGAVYLVLGALAAEGTLDDLAWARMLGERSSAYAGSSVATAGDQDGDGLDDVVVGSYDLSSGASQGGGAYVVYGLPVGDLTLDDAELRMTGDTTMLFLGTTVTGGSDLDGDGSPEVGMGGTGSPGLGDGEGAFVMFGPASGDLTSSEADLILTDGTSGVAVGGRVLMPGDVDGDGLGDLLDGSTSATVSGVKGGAAMLFVGLGAGTVSVDDAEAMITTDSTDRLGYLFYVGDLDGDGLNDLGVTAKVRSGGAGAATVWTSPLSGAHLITEADLTVSGSGTDGLGGQLGGEDVDGDGAADLLVGAAGDSTGGTSAGAAALYYGPASGGVTLDDADLLMIGGTMWGGDGAGVSAAMLGDLDGDGRSELLVGASGYDSPHTDGGAAFLVHVAGY